MSGGFAGVAAGLLVAAGVLPLLERRWPASPARAGGEGLRTDVAWLVFTPLVTKWLVRAALAALVVLFALAAGTPLRPAELAALFEARPAFAGLPRWLQVLLLLLVTDFAAYWMHRALHARPLWRFHAVHHSSEAVDWLSGLRVHPVNDALMRVAQAAPVLLLGLDPAVLATAVPLLVFYGVLVHANVPWRFGPLRFLLVSPAFHRWHHALDEDGTNRNFAALFPVFDLLFGTWHLPADRSPARFGAPGAEVPAGFAGQLAFPFRRRGRPLAAIPGRAPAAGAGR